MFRAIPSIMRILPFPTAHVPPSPTLHDVMKAIDQLHRNQAQILNAINALQYSVNQVMMNQTGALLVEQDMIVQLAPNDNVFGRIMAYNTVDSLYQPTMTALGAP